MQKGTIVGINPKGFGFIRVEGMEKDLFFHASDLVNTRIEDLNEGDMLEFEVVDSEKGDGKKNAVNVHKV
ncbi:MAG TPA: cold shock domain-containing protein [Candidatus Paceibacterota bacterium]|jgi:CspA family cold shock protein|nr:cold shock domain-containing protein [Candidatus Paceibacterota bacterium]